MAVKDAGDDKDKVIEGEEVPKDDFNDAFDEAIAGDKGDDEKPIDDDDDPEDEAEEKDEPTSDKPEEDDVDPEEKPDEDSEADPANKEKTPKGDDDEVETLETVNHKYKTVSGMFNSEVKKRQQLEDELALLREGKQPKPAEDDAGKPEDEKEDLNIDVATLAKTIADSESFKKLGDEYGEDMTKALTDMAGNIATTVVGTLSQKVDGKLNEFSGIIDPIRSDHAKSVDEVHFSALETAHPDYAKHRDSGELSEWINEQPGYKQKMYKEVYEKGATEDVIDLFSTFKDDKGYSATPPKKEEPVEKPEAKVNNDKLEDMEVVDRKNSPVSAVKGSAAKDDYEGAWEEA